MKLVIMMTLFLGTAANLFACEDYNHFNTGRLKFNGVVSSSRLDSDGVNFFFKSIKDEHGRIHQCKYIYFSSSHQSFNVAAYQIAASVGKRFSGSYLSSGISGYFSFSNPNEESPEIAFKIKE